MAALDALDTNTVEPMVEPPRPWRKNEAKRIAISMPHHLFEVQLIFRVVEHLLLACARLVRSSWKKWIDGVGNGESRTNKLQSKFRWESNGYDLPFQQTPETCASRKTSDCR